MSRPTRRHVLRTAAAAAVGGLAAGPARGQAGGTYALQGIDISHWQGTINWAAVRASGKRYAFCKATEGTGYTDPTFATNWAGMRANGLLRGAYHFARPAADAVTQADRLIDTAGFLAGDLRPVLDLEATDGLSTTAVRAWVVAFVGRVVERIGVPPIVYTGFYFWRDEAGNGSNLGCPLWLAAYVSNPAAYVPAAWTTFTLWQYTSSGACPGISGNVDLDAFNGSKTDLNNLRLS